ncbi:hypothetical protein AVEN_184078-1 [Araneus ventricosus]|uniref:Uncharacterized protein n=1 Tax=Araneus ventricosus TaxID=182803 RepID=A0A4Y2CZ36_ARAVE|nr:hypothetical protein AVEN_184078-1 [Araneus ventricosus]
MHFDTAVNWFDGTNHFMNMENEEVLRLKRLMHESILKVEKENLETIQKELCNQRETNVKVINQNYDSKKIPKHPSGPSCSTALRTRSASFRGVKQQQPSFPKVQTASHAGPSNINCANVCKNPQPMCQNSSIHFLNHFHSSFLSSKTQRNLQPYDVKEKYTACAVPLAPPCQKKEIIDLGQDFASHKSSVCVPNNVAYHVVSEDIPKKLTIQALPSISILGRKPSNNENVRIEEIREKNYSAGDCIKTTVLPAVSEEVRNRLSSINLNSIQTNKISASEEKNNEPSILHPKKSVFTQSSQNDESLQTQPDKGLLKEIIKEVLQEFQYEFPREFIKLSVDKNLSAHQNEQTLTSPENDCELDSFIGNADSLENDVATMVSSNTFMKSSYTQTTGCGLHHAASKEIDVKNLIHEVILEMQQNSSLKFNQSMEEPNNAFKMEKVHRDIQVNLKHDEINQEVISHTSKAVQASFIIENETLGKANKTPDVNDSFTEDDFKVISNPAIMKNNEIPECHGENTDAAATTEMPSKLESVLNFIYNRFCRETGELSLSTERILSNNSPPSVRTREVSIQFNPVTTSTKSTATSEVALIDASNQCDVLLPQQVEEKNIRHVSVQVLPEPEVVLPVQEKVDSSVQWEQPVSALRDSCVQTMEFLNPSENSANTSVSSTPVSDSIFLDDMLSEGEVFLPWNLRLLSHADKTAIQSSYNTTEASEKEKDYSLSEGEVPPKYLQQLNLAQSPSYDSSSEAYTDPPRYPQNASTPTQKSHFMSNPEAESLSVISHERYCHCQASGSSLSEGEVKCSGTSLSEGEIPFGFLKQRITFQHSFAAPSSGSISGVPQRESGIVHGNVLDSQNLGESSLLQENFGHSILDFSEGEVIGHPQMPYQSTPYTSFLDTVNEEK